MSRYYKNLKTTDNSSVYRHALTKMYSPCPVCGLNKGCNKNWKSDENGWKSHRNNQWKDWFKCFGGGMVDATGLDPVG